MATITGDSKNNRLEGTSGNDIIFGGAGNDTLLGLGGDDRLFGEAGDDRLDGGIGSDFLSGGDGNDQLDGGAGDDTLDGGAGDDTLSGGAGNNTYVIDSPGDRIVQSNNPTVTTVRSFITFNLSSLGLSAGLQNLILLGNADINGTGDSGDNVLVGNRGSNVLRGLAGDDRISGGPGGNDLLDGGPGNDILVGNGGNNTFVIDSPGDRIIGAGRGIDTVESSVDYFLGRGLENCNLRGNARLCVGNRLNNRLTGNRNNNTLIGGAGADTLLGNDGNDALSGGQGDDDLTGGRGNDTLTGGEGRDLFYYQSDRSFRNSDFGRDLITDFGGTDNIVLSRSTFGLRSSRGFGFSRDGEFATVANNLLAASSSARIVYSTGSRTLFLNTNGSSSGFGSPGSSGAFITFGGSPNLSALSFLIV